MRRAILIHWRPEEAVPRLAALRDAGWEAGCYSAPGGNLKPLREHPPEIFVIDLTRLPSHGREVASALRRSKQTRHVPIVFAGGEPEKVERFRQTLPDAVFCEWDGIAAAMTEALRTAPDQPVVRGSSASAGYSGTPLPKKLGIKEGTALTLLNAPQGFRRKLALPDGVEVHERPAEAHRVMLFVRDSAELRRDFQKAADSVAPGGGLWLVWPKKTSGLQTDIGGNDVRETGLALGWVDYKVCAVDETWSGLLFSRQRKIGSKLE